MKESIKKFHSRFLTWGILLLFFCPGVFADQTQQFKESYLLPNETIQEFLNRSTHYDVLNGLSPDGDHFMIPIRREFSSLELMSQKTYRLAMLEFCPEVNRQWELSTSGIQDLKIYSLEKRKSWMVDLPDDIFISDMTWSPEGKKIAFLAHLPQKTQVWVADVETGEAQPVDESAVMATLSGTRRWWRSATEPSQMLQWTPDGSILTFLVPSDRGKEPPKNPIPSTPIIRHTRKEATPTRTYPFLLRTPHHKKLLEYHTTSQLALLSPGKSPRKLGAPAMYMNISLSPDGKYILAEKMVKPFSYIVGYRAFPRELQVMDREGKILSTVRKVPLRETRVRNEDSPLEDLPREVSWSPDGKGLYFLWKEKKKENNNQEEKNNSRKDRLMFLEPPFDMEKARTLISSEDRLSDVNFSRGGEYAFLTRHHNGKQDILCYDISKKKPKKYVLVKDIDPDDLLELPGDLITQQTSNGTEYVLLSSDRNAAYLEGSGYKENFKHQPFIDKVSIKTGKKERLFESSSQMYERPLVPLDRDLNRMIISRESKTEFPDSYLWTQQGSLTQLTQNEDPFPEFADCQRVDFKFTRRDGLTAHGRISLPTDYKEGTRVPAIFWTYPREYQSFEDYKKTAIRRHNLNEFPHTSFRNASELWLSQGYAVVVPDIPIVGEGNKYNNNYIAHLVDSMYAAIRKVDNMGYLDVDRLGHGGHSYGAFATANILAHSPFFQAGIAGDGAYNRTLTPLTFQRERRFIWEAQGIYLEMSPFFEADHVETPLLMYHGACDDNSGTFLIQSERFMHALTGLGKTAVLYIYPFESHGPRCKETYMDLWARWLDWFDTYVKKEKQE